MKALYSKIKASPSNNVNQIARRVNSGGGVYPDEVDEICGKLTEASGLFDRHSYYECPSEPSSAQSTSVPRP